MISVFINLKKKGLSLQKLTGLKTGYIVFNRFLESFFANVCVCGVFPVCLNTESMSLPIEQDNAKHHYLKLTFMRSNRSINQNIRGLNYILFKGLYKSVPLGNFLSFKPENNLWWPILWDGSTHTTNKLHLTGKNRLKQYDLFFSNYVFVLVKQDVNINFLRAEWEASCMWEWQCGQNKIQPRTYDTKFFQLILLYVPEINLFLMDLNAFRVLSGCPARNI